MPARFVGRLFAARFCRVLLIALAGFATYGCGRPPSRQAQPQHPAPVAPPELSTPPTAGSDAARSAELEALYRARADSALSDFHAADVHFMAAMIDHHAQALVICGLAPHNGAGPVIRTLCARIINSQKDEIDVMRRWLRDLGLGPPETHHIGHGELATERSAHEVHMPGMLNAEQLDTLRDARGPDFDRFLLKYMIMHHEGAITMVLDLFATDGAAQDDFVFRLASDIQADQSSEIRRMELMLEALGG